MRRSATAAALTAAIICASLAAAPVSGASPAPTGMSDASPAPTAAVTVLELGPLEEAVRTAREVLEASGGKVLDDTVRTRLAAAVEVAVEGAELVRWRVVWPGQSPVDVRESASRELAKLLTQLNARTADVGESVTEWESDQQRIAAEEEARAAAAAAASRPGSGRASTPSGAHRHTEVIWTSGGQGQLDACRGSVNFPDIAAYLGGAFYAAEHWGCGGSAWGGLTEGSIVHFPGHGDFQVTGIQRGLQYGAASAADLAPGYAGYYQTCIGGSGSNMAVWLLTRAS